MTFLRQFLVGRYGWTYEEINAMRLHEAEVAAVLGRHGRSRDRRLVDDAVNSALRGKRR